MIDACFPVPALKMWRYHVYILMFAKWIISYGNQTHREDGTQTHLVLDRQSSLPNVLMEMDATDTPIRHFIWGPNGLLAQIEADGPIHYFHSDELGSTLALTDDAGTPTDQFSYTPYGKLIEHQGATDDFRVESKRKSGAATMEVIIYLAAVFVVMGIGIAVAVYSFREATNWSRFAKLSDPMPVSQHLNVSRWNNAIINGFQFNGTMKIGIDSEKLFLQPIFPLSIAMPAVLIPLSTLAPLNIVKNRLQIFRVVETDITIGLSDKWSSEVLKR